MFADKVRIYISSGRGGDGHVSFRRELYVPAGGPNGGDGGKGGDVIFVVDKGLNTLSDFRYNKKYCAQNGEEGGKNRCHGKSGEDLVIKVPEGTVIKDADSGLVIADMSGENLRKVILKGGRGGKGNMHYATSTMQAPRYAQPGEDGTGLYVTLELKLIADVGLIGLPNVGKSTLISRVSNAQPKIADYHFTTLNPVLGVVDDPDGAGFVIADIPGIIEGASSGAGLGYEFLRHIERTRVLIHVVDAAGVEGRDPAADIRTINNELGLYNEKLMERPQIIAANKMDALSEDEAEAVLAKLKNEFGPEGYEVYPISAVSGKGLKELIRRVKEILAESPEERIVFETEFTPEHQEIVLPYTVSKSSEEDGVYIVEGPRIERMLGYTNLESEKGLEFLQKFIQDSGITKQLTKLGIQEGDTVRMYGHEFEFFM